jgi:hypothetical protein
MAEPESRDLRDSAVGQDRPAPPRMPRWVKVSTVIVVVLALVFVVTRLAGVQHGPGLHTPDGSERPTPTLGHTPPAEHQP